MGDGIQVADKAQGAYHHHRAVEKQQGIPIDIADILEYVKILFLIIFRSFYPEQLVDMGKITLNFMCRLGQIKTEKLQSAQARHHTGGRRQFQYDIGPDRNSQCHHEKKNNPLAAAAQPNGGGGSGRRFFGNEKMHDERRQ